MAESRKWSMDDYSEFRLDIRKTDSADEPLEQDAQTSPPGIDAFKLASWTRSGPGTHGLWRISYRRYLISDTYDLVLMFGSDGEAGDFEKPLQGKNILPPFSEYGKHIALPYYINQCSILHLNGIDKDTFYSLLKAACDFAQIDNETHQKISSITTLDLTQMPTWVTEYAKEKQLYLTATMKQLKRAEIFALALQNIAPTIQDGTLKNAYYAVLYKLAEAFKQSYPEGAIKFFKMISKDNPYHLQAQLHQMQTKHGTLFSKVIEEKRAKLKAKLDRLEALSTLASEEDKMSTFSK